MKRVFCAIVLASSVLAACVPASEEAPPAGVVRVLSEKLDAPGHPDAKRLPLQERRGRPREEPRLARHFDVGHARQR